MTQIAIVGEAWGEAEDRERLPFVGPSGQELTRMLSEAGIVRASVYLTNVFNFRPKDNDLETLCYQKKDCPKGYEWPALSNGQYLRPEYANELGRLRDELAAVHPNLVIAAGGTATWALLRQTAISKIRGTAATSTLVDGLKVIPIYHPAAILRDWSLRHVTVLDLMKARVESEFPEIRRPARRISVPDTIEDIDFYINAYIRPAKELAFDIETASGQITCIGFAPATDQCLVIPITDYSKPDRCYWSLEDELKAWERIKTILALPMPKVAQNGLYDLQYLYQGYGIRTRNPAQDTMLLHHSLYPESPKGLDFLGSVYTNESSWKQLRARGKHTLKREE